jgi:glycosyltransferase involved in cell wall biosynthesis
MTSPPRVQVLLATFNGARFLREQIDSILAQTYQPLTILARDDGSSDGTPAILADYAQRFPDRFAIAPPMPPAGSAAANFLRLLQASSEAYLAFADQDDVWLPEKMAISMDAMLRLEDGDADWKPCLVFSDLSVVDERLGVIDPSFWHYQQIEPGMVTSLSRLLGNGVVTGCTAVLNRPLANYALRMPPEAFMHDWWIALLANCFGETSYVEKPLVLYRQHGANVRGASAAQPATAIPRWRYHRDRHNHWLACTIQAEALLYIHGAELSEGQRTLLTSFLRSGRSPFRVVRVGQVLFNGFWAHGLRRNLALLWYLWDRDEAVRQAALEAGPPVG